TAGGANATGAGRGDTGRLEVVSKSRRQALRSSAVGLFLVSKPHARTVGKGRYPIFETTSGVVLGRARILTWHPATLKLARAPARLPGHGWDCAGPVRRASRLCSRRFGGPLPQTGAALFAPSLRPSQPPRLAPSGESLPGRGPPFRMRSGAGRYGASGGGLKKPQAGTPVLRRGAFPGVQAPCETVGKGRYPIFETTSGVVLGRARILTWHRATLK